jgi:hypothetical protein
MRSGLRPPEQKAYSMAGAVLCFRRSQTSISADAVPAGAKHKTMDFANNQTFCAPKIWL